MILKATKHKGIFQVHRQPAFCLIQSFSESILCLWYLKPYDHLQIITRIESSKNLVHKQHVLCFLVSFDKIILEFGHYYLQDFFSFNIKTFSSDLWRMSVHTWQEVSQFNLHFTSLYRDWANCFLRNKWEITDN